MSSSPRDPAERAVAVVGLGAILPDALSAPAFWQNVISGRDCISEVPRDRWDPADYYDPDPKVPDKTYSKIGGWIRGFTFDPVRYRIPPKVAAAMDIGQHWMITAAAEALKDAGHPDRPLDLDNTAVIVGNAMGGERHYITTTRLHTPEFRHALEATKTFRSLPPSAQQALLEEFRAQVWSRLPETTEDTMPGELVNIMAGRVAAVFNLRGPNYSSDAACASSFAALQGAIDGLVDHHYDAVLTGGMDRNMGASTFVKFCKIGALSPDGSRPYAKGANGFVMGEGGALFLLKRVEDAEKAGDRIYAIIRSVGASSDGKGKGITAPNPAGQILAIRRAWERAGLSLTTVSLIEGHGTSTAVGDMAEISSITTVLGNEGLARGSIALGSVKSQIGHLKAGAGAAGLLKAVLSLHHKIVPPSINFVEPNPEFHIDQTPFWVPRTAQPWERPAKSPRRVGVSAFGFGGTNFHVVLEEYIPGLLTGPGRKTSTAVSSPAGRGSPASGGNGLAHGPGCGQVSLANAQEGSSVTNAAEASLLGNLLALGAPDAAALRQQLAAAVEAARGGTVPPKERPTELVRQSQERLVVSFDTAADLVKLGEAALAAFDKNDTRSWRLLAAKGVHRGSGRPGKVAFLYPGQGSQYVNMLGQLRRIEPVVAETFAEADEVMKPLLGRPLTDYLFVDSKDPSVLAKAEDELRATVITQPAVLTCGVALTRLLARHGIRPDLVMGHSLGEWAALVAAGMLPFADGLVAVSSRARGMASVAPPDPGKMASVLGPYDQIAKYLAQMDGYVVAANINSRNQTVIAGDSAAVDRAVEKFKALGFTAQLLPVSHAFHSRIVAAASGPLRKVLESVAIKTPQVPIVSNVDGELYPNDIEKIRDQLSIQLASPVQWVKSLETAYREGARVFIEVGPKRVLRGLAEDVLGERPGVVFLSTNHPKRGDLWSFHEGLCGLFGAGLPITRTSATSSVDLVATSDHAHTAAAPTGVGNTSSVSGVPNMSETRSVVSPIHPNDGSSSPDYLALGRIFARCLEEGLAVYGGRQPGAPAGQPGLLSGGTPVRAGTFAAKVGSVVISGAGLGLPGKNRHVFDDRNVDRILAGESFIDPVSPEERQKMVEKNIVRLVKREVGEPSLDPIRTTDEVLKLAAQKGAFDLVKEFGVESDRIDAYDVTTQLGIAAGLEALRDAHIPLVRNYRRTTTGSRLPDRWLIPRRLAEETGVIFSSAFPAQNALVEEIEKFHAHKLRTMIIEELAQYASDNPRARKRIAELEAELSRDGYVFSRKLLFKALAMGHSQFAEVLGARGPNTLINSACASATQAVGIATDWIESGKCRRVVIITADDCTSERLFQWIGSGFLASGAATTEARVELAALPFDRRRNGTILGMGAGALVLEAQDALDERGVRGITEVLGSVCANSAFHGTRLNVEHISEVMDRFVGTVEKKHGLSRAAMAGETMFMSHETYTPARGGSSAAEVNALKRVFGDVSDRIVIANTKGYTGHPMGVAIEDVVAVKALERQIVPPVPNFREVDPELGNLNISRGGHYPVRYCLRFAAGFGSQISMTFLRRVPGCEERIAQPAVYDRWLSEASGYAQPAVLVDRRTLKVRDQGAPEREPVSSTWQLGTLPAAVVLPRPAEEASALPGSASPSAPPPATLRASESVSAPSATVPLTPGPVTSAPASPAKPAAPQVDAVAERVLGLVSEKTGYPRDMLDLELDLEADLGIDTVKQAEVFALVRDAFDIARQDTLKLRDYPTLKHVIGFVRQHRPDLAVAAAAPAAVSPSSSAAPQLAAVPTEAVPATADHAGQAAATGIDPVADRVLELVSEKTGYPKDMLDLELDLEADLGIDTVKQAEVFALVRDKFEIARQDSVKLRDYPTLKHVIGFVRQHRPDLAAPPPTAAPKRSETVAFPVVAPPAASPVAGPPAVAAPAPVGSTSFAAAAAAPGDEIQSKVLAVVSEKTGYPPDMLDLELDLEADLGIDTVKQAEVFALVRDTFNIPRQDTVKLRDYPTLKHVIGFVRQNLPKAPQGAAGASGGAAEATAAATASDASGPAKVGSLLRMPAPVLRPAIDLCKATSARLASPRRVLIVADRGGVGSALSDLLRGRNVETAFLDADLDLEQATKQTEQWLKSGEFGGVYFLTALDPTPALADIEPLAFRDLDRRNIKLLCAVTRVLYDALGNAGTFLITGTRLGGVHGYEAAGATSPLGGSMTGFTKAIARERATAVVKAVDFAGTATVAEMAQALVTETERDPDVVEVGHRDGARFTIAAIPEEAAPFVPSAPMTLDANSVFVVTGGAGAITSAIVLDLCGASQATFHLLDLLPTPDTATRRDIERMASDREGLKRDVFEQIKASQGRATPAQVERRLFELERSAAILDTMRGIEAKGGKAFYHSVDVTSTDGVASAINDVISKSARIDVILHTAGLERSRTFDTKPQEEFDRVYGVKVDGLYNLLRATRSVEVGALVCFSSVAGRFGNAGQADYSAANDLMCKVCSSFRASRPNALAVAFDWSAWGGIGMATRGSVPEMMRRAGIEMLDPNEATPLVRRALTTGMSTEMVVGRNLGVLLQANDPDGGLDPEAAKRLAAGSSGRVVMDSIRLDKHTGLEVAVTLDPKKEAFLYDHQIDGSPVLPGAMGIELFAEVASLLVPGNHVRTIEKIRFQAPLKYYRNEPRTAIVRAVPFWSESGQVRVQCVLQSSQTLVGGMTQEKVHFMAEVVLDTTGPQTAPEKPNGSKTTGKKAKAAKSAGSSGAKTPHGTIDRDAIYRVYFHGPAYQVLSKVDLQRDGLVRGTIAESLPADREQVDAAWSFVPRLVELCFQTAGVYEIGLTARMGLPAAVDRAILREVPSSMTRLVAEVRPRGDGNGNGALEFDAQVRGTDGKVYVELEGYRTSTLPGGVPETELPAFRAVGKFLTEVAE